MELKQLQYFVSVFQTQNFTQSAREFFRTQPALSRSINALEAELGVKLFDRTTTPLSITPAGHHFIREAKELLYKEDQLLRSMEDYRSGQAGRGSRCQ